MPAGSGVEFLSRDFMQGVEDLIYEMAVDIEETLLGSMIDPRGNAYGDVVLSPDERIMKFMDDEQTGVNQELMLRHRDEYMERVRQFVRDAQSRGLGEVQA